ENDRRELRCLQVATGAVVLNLALDRTAPFGLEDARHDAHRRDSRFRMRRGAAASDLDDDLEARDWRTARELQLAANRMLRSGSDVSDARRGRADQAIVGHDE